MKRVVSVKNVAKAYDNKFVLKQVGFEIKKGELVALLGKNGAGKSTLLNVLLQLTPKDQGEIEILGEKSLKTEALGVMFQEDFVLERVTVKEIIELWRSYYPKSKSYAELIKIAGLVEKSNVLITKLSGGQRRRLYFALCLAGDPDLIILDEPTVGMDLESRQAFWHQIKKLQAAGKTFLITSHYLEELQNIAQRFLILQDGCITFAGTLQDLQQKYQKVTVRFRSSLKPSFFRKLAGVVQLQSEVGNYTLQTTKLNEFLKQLAPYLAELEDLNIEQGTLNELFLEITGGDSDVLSK